MGTYADTFGSVNIPHHKLPELTERMLTIARQGGMMDATQIERFSKTITLLTPVEVEDGCIDCIYNYFENVFWENAGFNVREGRMYSNKIGTRDFHAVVLAMYVLQEFYSTTLCVTNVDGRLFDATEYIGWLNHVLGEHYTNTHRIPGGSTPIPPVSSELFLRTTPDERAHWWREGGDMEFSPEMRRWLGELRLEYNKIIAHPGPIPANYERVLVSALAKAQEKWGVLFFASTFDEFMAHSEHRDVQAALMLLSRILDGYATGGEYLTRDGWVWNTPYSRFNDDFGKYAIKLYFAVLANPELRQNVFGF